MGPPPKSKKSRVDRQSEMDEYRDNSSTKRAAASNDYEVVKGLKSYIKEEMDLLLEDLMVEIKLLLDQKFSELSKKSSGKQNSKQDDTSTEVVVTEVKSLRKEVSKLRKQSRNMFAMLNLMRVLGKEKKKDNKNRPLRRSRRTSGSRYPSLENVGYSDSESSGSSSEYCSSEDESSVGDYSRKKGPKKKRPARSGRSRKKTSDSEECSEEGDETVSETSTDSEEEESESEKMTIKDSDESENESELDSESDPPESFDEGYFKTDNYKPRPTKSRNIVSPKGKDNKTAAKAQDKSNNVKKGKRKGNKTKGTKGGGNTEKKKEAKKKVGENNEDDHDEDDELEENVENDIESVAPGNKRGRKTGKKIIHSSEEEESENGAEEPEVKKPEPETVTRGRGRPRRMSSPKSSPRARAAARGSKKQESHSESEGEKNMDDDDDIQDSSRKNKSTDSKTEEKERKKPNMATMRSTPKKQAEVRESSLLWASGRKQTGRRHGSTTREDLKGDDANKGRGLRKRKAAPQSSQKGKQLQHRGGKKTKKHF